MGGKGSAQAAQKNKEFETTDFTDGHGLIPVMATCSLQCSVLGSP
jgi:hypothetical protein